MINASPTVATSTLAAERPTQPVCRPRLSPSAPTPGIALDGDADRLIAVDEHGDVVDGDHVIAICASDMRARACSATTPWS